MLKIPEIKIILSTVESFKIKIIAKIEIPVNMLSIRL